MQIDSIYLNYLSDLIGIDNLFNKIIICQIKLCLKIDILNVLILTLLIADSIINRR